jgi:hypothetical protein
MNIPLWASELAAAFWDSAGGPEPFPRTLRAALLRSPFELTVKELPALGLREAERYLAGLGVAWACPGPDRRLRACLTAAEGAGFILLDAADAPAERVVSLAHELGHFLRHYLQPRRLACRRLGASLAEVIDGRRPPTAAERVRALLANVPLGLHVHLMERGPRREILRTEVAAAEEEADQLAYELLAPAAAVLERTGPAEGAGGRARVAAVLREVFALPAARAEDYAGLLVPVQYTDPLLQRLGLRAE